MYQGSCLCGAVRYEITQELTNVGLCHCRSCRKASGSAYGANASLAREHFSLSDPQHRLREYESSPGKVRVFCSNCGSPLYAYLRRNPESLRIRLGSLDTPFHGPPKAHAFVADKAPWEVIGDELPQFDEWPS